MTDIIIKNAVKREQGYLYYVDGEGNVCKAKMESNSDEVEKKLKEEISDLNRKIKDIQEETGCFKDEEIKKYCQEDFEDIEDYRKEIRQKESELKRIKKEDQNDKIPFSENEPEDEETFNLEESVETLIKEQENPSIEILNKMSIEEIKEEIKKLIPLNETSSFIIYKYIEDYLLDYNLTTREIPYENKLSYKIDKIKRLLEKEIEEKLKKKEQDKKELIKNIYNQKLEIVLSLVEWAKKKSLTHNIFSHKDILVFLKQKGYIVNEDDFYGNDFREIWLEVKSELRKK